MVFGNRFYVADDGQRANGDARRGFPIANRKSQIENLLPILLLFLLPGCNLVGALADKALGKGNIDAKFIPTTQPMVVVAENWRNPAGSDVDVEQLMRFEFDELRAHNVGFQINPMAVIDLKSQSSEEFRKLSIAAIGRRVGARQVLYINVTSTSVTGPVGSDSMRGNFTGRVKLIDAETGAVLWPTDQADGFYITADTEMTEAQTETEDSELRRLLQKKAAVRIAKLFYKSEAEE